MRNKIFSMDSPKAIKARKYGWLNAIHYMAPADTAGVGNLCPFLSQGCKGLCLGKYSGQASMVSDLENGMNSVRQSRADKARRFMRERAAYMVDVVASIEKAILVAAKAGQKLCVRMNGSTDISWESIKCERNGVVYRSLLEAFPDVQFVDYTKNPLRFNRPLPANYHLTFSRSETNENSAIDLLCAGVNVAVVFAGGLPRTWNGFHVVNGDKHDLRQLDPRGGYVIGLSPKGNKAKKDQSGFVVRQAA